MAVAAARKALEIDNGLAEAHAALAYADLYNWNWAQAEQRFRKAIELNPSYASAHLWYSHHLSARRRFNEALQEVFVRVYHSLGAYDPQKGAFSTWLHRIAVNCSIDVIRSRPHRESAHDDVALEQFGAGLDPDVSRSSPERLMQSTEVQERITAAMTALTQMERAAFVLRHFEGQSIEEIARALGLKANAAKHSIFRAVRKMRLALEPFVEG